MVSAQRNPTNMPAPIQHLAPGSPLLPMASPLAMFDVSPFQVKIQSIDLKYPPVPGFLGFEHSGFWGRVLSEKSGKGDALRCGYDAFSNLS